MNTENWLKMMSLLWLIGGFLCIVFGLLGLLIR
jgi:hypothetical protein